MMSHLLVGSLCDSCGNDNRNHWAIIHAPLLEHYILFVYEYIMNGHSPSFSLNLSTFRSIINYSIMYRILVSRGHWANGQWANFTSFFLLSHSISHSFPSGTWHNFIWGKPFHRMEWRCASMCISRRGLYTYLLTIVSEFQYFSHWSLGSPNTLRCDQRTVLCVCVCW